MSDAGGGERRRLTSAWIAVDGRRWHVRVSAGPAPPGAPPIVLVHGLGVSGRYLVPTGERLSVDHPVYAPDLPGFGRTAGPHRALGVGGLADALAAWTRAAGLERPVMLGNSLGCQVIVDLAVRYPERLRAAVLVGPTTDPRARSLLRQFGRLLLDVPREPPRLIPLQARDYLAAGPVRVLQTARSMVRDPITAKLPLVRQPTLIVRGERDPIVPQRWAEEATRLLPHGRLVVVSGAAHAVNYGAPDALAAAVRDFLAEDGDQIRATTTGAGAVGALGG